MRTKSAVFLADSKNRDIGSLVDKGLSAILESLSDADIIDVKINIDFSAGGYGKAFVVVLYSADEKKISKK